MGRPFNFETFVFIDEQGKHYDVMCYSTRTQVRTTEHAECEGYEGKSYWYNRPWQRFDYDNALSDIAEKLANGNAERLKAFKTCIDARAKSEQDACDAFISAFKKDYDSLSDTTKKHLANANITITSEEQAKDIMAVSKAFDMLFRLEESNKGQ